MKGSNLSMFRRMDRVEEQLVRACMPRTAQADPEALPAFAAATRMEVLARRCGTRLLRPVPSLTFTIAEVANA